MPPERKKAGTEQLKDNTNKRPPRARKSIPEDDPNPIPNEGLDELPVRCPKCHSTEVIFEGQTSAVVATDATSQKYQWTCDACGHQWEDDGIVREG